MYPLLSPKSNQKVRKISEKTVDMDTQGGYAPLMDQITSINNAISAQANRVDAIRRALQPLPGKLHQLDVNNITRSAFEDKCGKAAVAIESGKVIPAHLLQQTANVIAPIIEWTGKMSEYGKGDLKAKPDGMTTSILRSKRLDRSSDNYYDNIFHAISTNLAETGLLSHDVTFINSDIIDLLLHASSSLEPEAIHYEDLIAPSGFCYLEKPIIVGDYHPDTGEFDTSITFGWRAFAWCVTEGGLNFYIYSDWGCYRYLYLPSTEDHDPVAPSLRLSEVAAWRDDDIFICDVQRWDLDKPWSASRMTADEQQEALIFSGSSGVVVNPHVELFRKFFLTMMRFCWQELLVSERATVTRQIRRAAVRDLGKDFTMNVLRLRRIKKKKSGEDDEPGEGHRLDHRIVVRGHWVNQYYSSRGPCLLEDGTTNPASHQRIWKDPYVKGPEDAPFVRKHKINALVR